MRVLIRVGFMVGVLTLFVSGISNSQEELTKRDSRGPVAVTVTLTAPPTDGASIKVKVVLDTHSVSLDRIEFEKTVAMRIREDIDIMPSLAETKGGGHHREALLVFPPVSQGGKLMIVVKNVGGVPERLFSWDCPVVC